MSIRPILTAVAVAVSLTACAGGGDPEPAPTVTVTASPEPAPTVTVTAEPVEVVPQVCRDAIVAADAARGAGAPAMQNAQDLATLVMQAYQAGRLDATSGGEQGASVIAEEAGRIAGSLKTAAEEHEAATMKYLELANDCTSR